MSALPPSSSLASPTHEPVMAEPKCAGYGGQLFLYLFDNVCLFDKRDLHQPTMQSRRGEQQEGPLAALITIHLTVQFLRMGMPTVSPMASWGIQGAGTSPMCHFCWWWQRDALGRIWPERDPSGQTGRN